MATPTPTPTNNTPTTPTGTPTLAEQIANINKSIQGINAALPANLKGSALTPIPQAATPVAPTTTPPPPPTAPPAPAAPTAPASPATPAPVPQPTTPSSQSGVYYYTVSQDANGKPVYTYYDSNANALPTNPLGGDQYKNNPQATPNANGRLVQLPSAPTQGGMTTTPPTPEEANAAIQGSTATYTSALNDLNNQADQAYSDYKTKLDQIENGTFPLTPSQQAILDATKAQFDTLRQQQIIANQTYTQGLSVYESRTGELTGGVETAMGNIKNSIDQGIAKLNALDSQAALTLANLQQGFQSDNLKMITAAYDEWQKYQSGKENALKEIQDAQTSALKDLRDFTYKQTQDNINNTLKQASLALDQGKFDWQKTQDEIKNKIDQANLGINERKQALAEAQYQLQKDLLDKLRNGLGNAPQKNPVTGTVNPADQQKFLAQYPPEVQANIKAVANYQAPLSTFPQRLYKGQVGYTQADYLAMASAYTGDTFTAYQYQLRYNFMKNWSSGGMAAMRSSAGAAVQHLKEVLTDAKSLNNDELQKLNGLKNWWNAQTGDGNITKFQTDINAFAGEYAKFIVSNLGSVQGATEDDRQHVFDILSPYLAPDQFGGFGNAAANLIRDRASVNQDIYAGQMGKVPDATNGVFTPSTIQAIAGLKDLGVTTDFSYVLPQDPYANATPQDLLNMGNSTSSSSGQDNSALLQNILNIIMQPQPQS